MRYYLVFFLLLLLPSQLVIGELSDFEGEEYNFRIKEAADYTNHLDNTMLISVEANQEVAYSLKGYGTDNEANHWISGIIQVEVEKEVTIGALNYSGFEATEKGEKTARVSPFNYTLTDPQNYSEMLVIDTASFVINKGMNTTIVDNSTLSSIFMVLNPIYFVLDPEVWIDTIEARFGGFTTQMDSFPLLTASVESDDRSFSYSVSGEMIDIHTFTYPTVKITSPADYNIIDISGGFSISYDEIGVLKEYSVNYDISFDDTRIMQYSYSIKVGSGSIGNIQVGDAGFFPILNLPLVLVSILLLLPVIRQHRREN